MSEGRFAVNGRKFSIKYDARTWNSLPSGLKVLTDLSYSLRVRNILLDFPANFFVTFSWFVLIC